MLCVLVHYVCESRRAPDAVILHLACLICLKSLFILLKIGVFVPHTRQFDVPIK